MDGDKVLVLENTPYNFDQGSRILEFDLTRNASNIVFKHSFFSFPRNGGIQKTFDNKYLITNSSRGYVLEFGENKKKTFSLQ